MLTPTHTDARREIHRFLVTAARLLHRHGTPAHRTEATLIACAAALGQRLQVFAGPTSVDLAFGGRRQRTHLIRADAGEAELGRLVDLDAVISAVRRGELSPRAGRRALRKVASAPPPFGPASIVAAFALASAGAARFFSGNLAEIGLSFVLGLGLGLLAISASERVGLGRVFAPLAAFLAALASLTAEALAPGIRAQVTTMAALIVLIPGLSLTLAMTELATRHLVSGTARLAGSLTVFATMAFGVAIASALLGSLAGSIDASVELPPALLAPLPPWTRVLALVLAPLGFGVLFQARLADFPAIAATGVVGAELAHHVARTVDPVVGAFAGALVVGLAANTYAAWRRLPAAVILLPSLLLLVPGSLGFRSVTSFLAQDVLAAMDVGFRMILLAVALVAGVLVANTIVLPRVRAPATEHKVV